MQHAWQLYQIIIYYFTIHRSDKFYVTWRSDRKTTWNSHILNELSYQANCAYKMLHSSDKISLSLIFIRKPICSAHMANFLYELGFLGPRMYGYATVSYSQMFDPLKFWPAHTVETTDVLELKQFLNWPLSETIINSRYHRRVISTYTRISKRVHK